MDTDIEIVEISSDSDDNSVRMAVDGPAYGCYLLLSMHDDEMSKTLGKRRTYIGSTYDFAHRLRQHNGYKGGGANRTRNKRPWYMVCTVAGFTSRTEALQFEWAWQHPSCSRHLRALCKTMVMPPHGSNVIFALRGIKALLSVWTGGLTCTWHSDEVHQMYIKL